MSESTGTTYKITIPAATVGGQLPAVQPDPEYDLVKKLPKTKRGRQCGRCGMKFDYGISYGYYCSWIECPMGFGMS